MIVGLKDNRRFLLIASGIVLGSIGLGAYLLLFAN